MKKKLTKLACLWLAVIMLATTVFAADVSIGLYTGDGVLSEGEAFPTADAIKEIDVEYEGDKVRFNTDAVLGNLNLTGRRVTGWNIWSNLSGNLESVNEYSYDDDIPVSAVERNLVEPVYEDYYEIIFQYYTYYPNMPIQTGTDIRGSHRKFSSTGPVFYLSLFIDDSLSVNKDYEITGWRLWKPNVEDGTVGEFVGEYELDHRFTHSDFPTYQKSDNPEISYNTIVEPILNRVGFTGRVCVIPCSMNILEAMDKTINDFNTFKYVFEYDFMAAPLAFSDTNVTERAGTPANGSFIEGWQLWKYSVSGGGTIWLDGEEPIKEYELDGEITMDDIAANGPRGAIVPVCVDYAITHQPTTDEPYVETNNDDDVAEYRWYQVGEEDTYTNVAKNEMDEVVVGFEPTASCDADGWWSDMDGRANEDEPHYLSVVCLDLIAGDAVKIETAGDSEVSDVVIGDGAYSNLLMLTEVSDGVWEATVRVDMPTAYPEIYYTDDTYTANDKYRITVTRTIRDDVLVDGESDAELSSGEDGKEYYAEVEFEGETVLTSDSFEWETPKKQTNNGTGGGLQTGGDMPNKGSNEDGNQEQSKPEVTIPDTSGEITSNKLFDDAPVGSWFEPAAEWMGQKSYMTGTAPRTFSPDVKMNRAMMVTILWRINGSIEPQGECKFEDVVPGSYYEKAVVWANENEIILGTSENTFSPDMLLTREQLATIIFRDEVRKGMDAVTLEENLTRFSDADEISEYAVSALNWAVGQGIINGVDEDTLAPKREATRAECATILYRIYNK